MAGSVPRLIRHGAHYHTDIIPAHTLGKGLCLFRPPDKTAVKVIDQTRVEHMAVVDDPPSLIPGR